MGWTFPYDTAHRSELIRERVQPRNWTNDNGSTVQRTALKHCYKGGMRSGVLYIVWEQTITPKDGNATTMRFIEVDLLQYHRSKDSGTSWGYKDMDCCCGPCQLSCPVSYLDLCPPHTTQFCKGWHDKVRALASAKKDSREKLKGLKPGYLVALVDGLKIKSGTIRTIRPLVIESGYNLYRIKPDQIDWAQTRVEMQPV